MLLGQKTQTAPNAPRLLFVKARIQGHHGEASAPAQAPMVLGAVARELGWEVRCVDTYLERDPERSIGEAVRDFCPKVIGVSAHTAESRSMHHLARFTRNISQKAIILAGGPHPSAEPEETALNTAIDAAVVGEGETTLCEILRRVVKGQEWREVDGILYMDADGTIKRTSPRSYIKDLDSLPLPAWDLTDINAYSRRRGMSRAGKRRYMPLTTSRGCPYRCIYCHDINGKRFRAHSPDYVLRMVDELRNRYDVHNYDITDDIVNFDPQRLYAICDGLIARGPGIGFTCPNGIRADRMTVDLADRMARAGCQYVSIAIETATPRLQEEIKKKLKLETIEPIIDAFTSRRVFTSGFFMLGFPNETEKELRATINFAIRSKLHTAYFFVVTPFGGTEMHEYLVNRYGKEATQLRGDGMYLRPCRNFSQIPDARFYKLRREAYRRFYFDPVRIYRICHDHRRRLDLAEYAATLVSRDLLRLDPGRIIGPLARLRTSLKTRLGRNN